MSRCKKLDGCVRDGTIFNVIQVNMTSMMVLSGLYISVSNSLPATDYVKYIQIWFIFSLVYIHTQGLIARAPHISPTCKKTSHQISFVLGRILLYCN